MPSDIPHDSEVAAVQDSYVDAASDAIRKTFLSREGIATSLSKDVVTISYTVPRDSLSRAQIETIMAAHMANT